jgi:hypothetical protein
MTPQQTRSVCPPILSSNGRSRAIGAGLPDLHRLRAAALPVRERAHPRLAAVAHAILFAEPPVTSTSSARFGVSFSQAGVNACPGGRAM